jgi:sterol desaturase/sphingolipid hydroxylase (fatty acid hydroxylase superfamily)
MRDEPKADLLTQNQFNVIVGVLVLLFFVLLVTAPAAAFAVAVLVVLAPFIMGLVILIATAMS